VSLQTATIAWAPSSVTSTPKLPSEGRRWFLREVLARLPEGSLVLELGCGPGTDARPLWEDRRYLGLDLSPVQLSIARQYASSGMFVCGDLTTTLFRPLTFDGIVAFYAFNHVPQRELEQAFAASFECLRSGGYLMLAGLPTFKDEDRVEEWLGVPMFFAGVDPDAYDRTLRKVGFEIEMSELRFGSQEPWGWTEPRWIIARKSD
jgi:cyclopropane fatty-acyl-phospholipid synthase-like methyltransferase